MIESSDNTISYVVSTSDTFAFPYRYLDADYIECYLTDAGVVTRLEGGEFSVNAISGSVGANIVLLLDPLPAGQTLTIRRIIPLTQGLTLPNTGKLPTESLELQLDKIVMITQQFAEELGRCVRVAVGSGVDPNALRDALLAAAATASASATAAAGSAAAAAGSAAAASGSASIAGNRALDAGTYATQAMEYGNSAANAKEDAEAAAENAGTSAINAEDAAALAVSTVSGTARYPDYTSGVSVLASYNAGGHTYTIPADGWILVRSDELQGLRINNGDTVPLNDLNSTRWLPVKAGDVLTGTGTTGALIHLNFFLARS